MNRLVLFFATAALLSSCQSANIRNKALPEIDNYIEPRVPSKPTRRMVAITRRPGPVYIHKAGTTLELTCEAVGAPAPNVRWFKNNAPVYGYESDSNELKDTNPSSIARVNSTILVSKSGTQDEYTCLVTAGQKTKRASTIVYSKHGSTDLSERSRLVPLEPRILLHYSIYMDTIGSTVVLPCRAKGHPRPHITWTDLNGLPIRNHDRMQVFRSGELVISSLGWNDMGEYTCKATNAFGSQEVKTFLYPVKAG